MILGEGYTMLYTIVPSIIGFTQSHGMLEGFAHFFSLLLFFLLLPFTFRILYVIIARFSLCRTSELSKSRSGLIRGLKCLCKAMSSSILSVFRARCFLRIDSLFSISLTICLRSCTSAMFVSGEVSTMTSYIMLREH